MKGGTVMARKAMDIRIRVKRQEEKILHLSQELEEEKDRKSVV